MEISNEFTDIEHLLYIRGRKRQTMSDLLRRVHVYMMVIYYRTPNTLNILKTQLNSI